MEVIIALALGGASLVISIISLIISLRKVSSSGGNSGKTGMVYCPNCCQPYDAGMKNCPKCGMPKKTL